MKKIFTLKRVIAVISAISVTVCGSLFFVIYANSQIKTDTPTQESVADEKGEETTKLNPSTVNVITPSSECSYGELMFAYIGKNNYLYNLDKDKKPLVLERASSLLYASDDSVLYTASTETDANHPGREYVIRELQVGEKENTLNTISTVSLPPCWSSNDEVIYYVEEKDRKQLCTFEPLTSTVEKAAKFEEKIMGLRISSDGLLVTLESGEEELYVPLSKGLTKAHFDSRNCIIKVCEQYDLVITSKGELLYRWIGSSDAAKVSDNVITAQGYQDNEILYVKHTDKGNALYDYYVSEGKNKKLCDLPSNILPQLTVSAEYAFVIDESFNVFRYDMVKKEYSFFTHIDKNVLNPMISVFDYRLMVYDLSRNPDNNFICEYSASKAPVRSKPFRHKHKGGRGHMLTMTSIGKDVLKLQQDLNKYGYLSDVPTGVFDINTMIAVEYLQNDMGYRQTGIVNPEMRMKLESEEQSKFQKFEALSLSSKGVRINDINERLFTLGYDVAPDKNNVTQKTNTALKNFAKENDVKSENIYGKALMKKLFSKEALKNNGYYELEEGDICVKANLLNERLKELGYLNGSVNPSVDQKTIEGINIYQKANGLETTPTASASLQKSIFSKEAKRCPEELAPDPIVDTGSKNKGQVISDRQLKIIRKWLTKQFAINHTDKQAVKRLQKQLEASGYLKAQDITMVYDQNTFNAVMEFQKKNSITADGIASKSTLTKIFSSTIAS